VNETIFGQVLVDRGPRPRRSVATKRRWSAPRALPNSCYGHAKLDPEYTCSQESKVHFPGSGPEVGGRRRRGFGEQGDEIRPGFFQQQTPGNGEKNIKRVRKSAGETKSPIVLNITTRSIKTTVERSATGRGTERWASSRGATKRRKGKTCETFKRKATASEPPGTGRAKSGYVARSSHSWGGN